MVALRVGIIGTGFILDYHLRGLRADPRARVVGVARDCYGSPEQRSQQLAALRERCSREGLRAFDSPAALIEDREIDAVVVGSINPYHDEQIQRALACDKHLLVEKPVLTDWARLAELEAQVRGRNVVLFPAHNFAYRPAVRQAAAWVREGRLGRLIHGSFAASYTISEGHQRGWRASLALAAGGALMDSGHHLAYQALLLLGPARVVQAFTTRHVLTHMEGEDTAQVSIQHANGALGSLLQSWASAHGDFVNGIRLLGDRGTLLITDALYFGQERHPLAADYESSFEHQARAFVSAVLEGEPPLSSLADARASLALIRAAYASAASGRGVEVVD
jgi:predicted dehydrogenase